MTDKINYRDKNGCCSAATYDEQAKCRFYIHSEMMGCCVVFSVACGRCGSFQTYLDGKEKIKCCKRQPLFYLRTYALEIAIALVIAVAIIFLFLSTFYYVHPVQQHLYTYPELDKYFPESVATPEYHRLWKYHGYPSVVIFSPAEKPYFYRHGKKCTFDYPQGVKRNG